MRSFVVVANSRSGATGSLAFENRRVGQGEVEGLGHEKKVRKMREWWEEVKDEERRALCQCLSRHSDLFRAK